MRPCKSRTLCNCRVLAAVEGIGGETREWTNVNRHADIEGICDPQTLGGTRERIHVITTLSSVNTHNLYLCDSRVDIVVILTVTIPTTSR
jgi:hypothetical protein